MTPAVSIASLIYASTAYADSLWRNLCETTPELATGEAEFTFVANDATPAVIRHLRDNGIPHVVQENERLSTDELVKRGIGKPEYIRRVYQGWNCAVMQARADCLVLLSSDHLMRPGWLAGLRSKWSRHLALSTLTIEPRGSRGVFPSGIGGGTGAVRGDHGRTLAEFDAAAFENHALSLECDRFTPGGAHQPIMISRQAVIDAGLYPEGNLHDGRFDRISEYGDRRLFRLLRNAGIRHTTWHGTVAYHFQEGEMRESIA